MGTLPEFFNYRALENTLLLMNSRNETYRKSFSNVEETSEEFEMKKNLEQQLKSITDKNKYKRRQIKELQEDLQTMTTTSQGLTIDEQELISVMEEKQKIVGTYGSLIFSAWIYYSQIRVSKFFLYGFI